MSDLAFEDSNLDADDDAWVKGQTKSRSICIFRRHGIDLMLLTCRIRHQ